MSGLRMWLRVLRRCGLCWPRRWDSAYWLCGSRDRRVGHCRWRNRGRSWRGRRRTHNTVRRPILHDGSRSWVGIELYRPWRFRVSHSIHGRLKDMWLNRNSNLPYPCHAFFWRVIRLLHDNSLSLVRFAPELLEYALADPFSSRSVE